MLMKNELKCDGDHHEREATSSNVCELVVRFLIFVGTALDVGDRLTRSDTVHSDVTDNGRGPF